MDFSLIATGSTFPLVFSITQAFARRERATVLIANMKASIVALYFMHRDWDQGDQVSAGRVAVQAATKRRPTAALSRTLPRASCFLCSSAPHSRGGGVWV